MHLRGLAFLALFLPSVGRRSMRINEFLHDAQQQNSTVASRIEVSAEAREVLIPGGSGTRVARRAGLQGGALRAGAKQDDLRPGHIEPHRVAPWIRFGPRHAKVALQADSGPEEDYLWPKEEQGRRNPELAVGGLKRRVLLSAILAAAAAPAAAELGGPDDPNKMQVFESAGCARRTPLGACAELAEQTVRQVPEPTIVPSAPAAEPESELVQALLARTEENKEKNDRIVLEKTIAANMPGLYGPLAKVAPVMRADGSFDDVPLKRFDKLRDRKKIVKTATGLNAYAPGFDPDAPEPRQKLFGIF